MLSLWQLRDFRKRLTVYGYRSSIYDTCGLQLYCFIHFVLQNSFQFGGVHCGALATIKFKLSNMVRILLYWLSSLPLWHFSFFFDKPFVVYCQTRTEADMVFDLSRYLDFSLKFLDADLEGIVSVYQTFKTTLNKSTWWYSRTMYFRR